MNPTFRFAPLARLLAPAVLGLGLAAGASAQTPPDAAAPLALKVLNADANSFHVNAVLVSGQQDAVLLDTGFSQADAHRIAAMVLDSGKTLKTIVVTAADPDYYFGAAALKQWFPDAKLVAPAPTLQKIRASADGKLQFWGPKLGGNAPKAVVLPEPMDGRSLQLEGRTIEVRGLDDTLPHRSYLWIPSIRAVVGGVNVFGGLHVWTADTQGAEQRAAWQRKLAEIAALQPATVVPGHMAAGWPTDVSSIAWTQAYLARFEQALPKAADAAALKAEMSAAYPQAGLPIALDIGAKVAKGEMKW